MHGATVMSFVPVYSSWYLNDNLRSAPPSHTCIYNAPRVFDSPVPSPLCLSPFLISPISPLRSLLSSNPSSHPSACLCQQVGYLFFLTRPRAPIQTDVIRAEHRPLSSSAVGSAVNKSYPVTPNLPRDGVRGGERERQSERVSA